MKLIYAHYISERDRQTIGRALGRNPGQPANTEEVKRFIESAVEGKLRRLNGEKKPIETSLARLERERSYYSATTGRMR